MKQKRHLVLTSIEKTWDSPDPILFLGEWCRLYNRKHVWSQLDHEVAEPFGVTPEELLKNTYDVQRISDRLLDKLAVKLNEIHAVTYSHRFWHILIGHWVFRYTCVLYNRYHTILNALSNHNVSSVSLMKPSRGVLVAKDSQGLIWSTVTPHLDLALCSLVVRELKNKFSELQINEIEIALSHEPTPSVPKTWKSQLKSYARAVLGAVGQFFTRENDALIIGSYLPKRTETALALSFGQYPVTWQSIAFDPKITDTDKRDKLTWKSESSQTPFEDFLAHTCKDLMPICYLESFSQLIEEAKKLPWPRHPRFIFTSNNFDGDELFKAWTGLQVSKGTPYFAGQHGNNYGSLLGVELCTEQVTPDKFITWGWKNNPAKDVPAFVFKSAGRKQKHDPKGNLLLIQDLYYHRMYIKDTDWLFKIYTENQHKFVSTLANSIQERLMVRLHSSYKKLPWNEDLRWRDFNPTVCLEEGKKTIGSLISQSRLVVHSYDSTGVLETLALNIPTLCFWHGDLNHLIPQTKPYYSLLKSAGIICTSPEDAANTINLIWNDVDDWWMNPKRQAARIEFANHYARQVHQPVRTLKRILSEESLKISAISSTN